jgi:acetyl esterase/lipase
MMARSPVNPALERIAPALRVPFLPRAQSMDLARLTWPRRLMRWFGYLSARNLPAPQQKVNRDLRFIASADGRARLGLRIHRPEGLATGSPALLWIHGGGYVMGAACIDDRLCALMAARAGLLVVAADYRLAPEHPYPVPLEDCYSALAWLHGHASELGVDASRIAIGGASAGGGLAAALALLARDRNGPKPGFQLLNYPMLDDRTASSADSPRGEWVWGAAANRDGWSAYLGSTAPAQAMVPARAASLAGLPPAWVGCGTLDLFHPEDEAYAQRLSASGVRCHWVSVEGAYHGFDVSAPRAEASRDYFESQMRALREALDL